MRQLYQFKEEDAFAFAQRQGIEARKHGKELTFRICPICKGGRGGKRDTDTFSINLETGACNCLRASCRYTGNMITLARDFDFSLGREVDEYYQPKRSYRKFKTPEKPIVPREPAIKYLEFRGISEEVAKKYEITTYTGHDNILVFPFYDEEGKLQYIKYRKTDFKKGVDRAKEWSVRDCKPILFGMKQCNLENKTLILCEGQMDSLSVATAGIENAVSVPNGAMGFTWIPYCFTWMCNFKEIVVFGDYEKGNITLLEDIRRRFPQTIKHVREEDYKDCKDANELLIKYGKQAVVYAVENAITVPVKRVVLTRDVGTADFSKVKKLRTNIFTLDRYLGGGLPFGTVCLLTGRRGDGKSCFATNLITGAVDQDYTTFVYSGEMRKEYVKRSIVLQAAGQNHIIENQTVYGKQRLVTDHNRELIERWLGERSFLYDCDEIDDEDEDLLETIEKTIQQNGVNVILIDNLMTAMYLDEERAYDKYDKQGRFVRKLTRLAVIYDVLIILVAHRRKTSVVVDANDEVSGSADITNLAGVVISYDRPTKQEVEIGYMDESQRKIILSKNRFYGTLDFDGIVVSYDSKSTRVYDDTETNHGMLTYEYSWGGSEDNGWLNNLDDNPFV